MCERPGRGQNSVADQRDLGDLLAHLIRDDSGIARHDVPPLVHVSTNSIEQMLEGRSRRMALKSPMCAVKLTPGRNQVETLQGQRSDRPTSLNVLRIFRNLDSRPCNRTGRVTRSVGHAYPMVRVRGRFELALQPVPLHLAAKQRIT
jgi:hypothetical protein